MGQIGKKITVGAKSKKKIGGAKLKKKLVKPKQIENNKNFRVKNIIYSNFRDQSIIISKSRY